MAAPSGIVWGGTVGNGSYQARIGIYVKLTSTATQTTRHTEIWFWSKYSVSDSGNTFYYNDNATSATTSKGSVTVKTTVSSGSGWSTSNQIRLASYDETFTRGTSATTRNVAAKLTGVDIINATMTATTSYTIPALAKYTVSYNANGGTGAPGNQTKYYGKSLTLSSTKPTRTGYTFKGWATSANGSVVNQASGTYTGNSAVTYYAVWQAITYTVSYNANGGSGQPSSQTKTYGVALTLSSTKPTRTGYSFVSWNTKSDGSGTSYAAGASYTSNSAVTLYAVWKANTYTVSYNANGGTGAPGNQTKTYGVNLTLSSTKPTRTNYTFKGWATSAGGSVVYASDANYTANAAVTLYAVWELSYVKPTIKNCSVSRCNSSGTTVDDGTYARIKFTWSSFVNNPTALIEWKETTVSSWSTKTVSLSGTGGTVDQIIGNGELSTEKSYNIRVTVDDGKDPQSITKSLLGIVFPVDVLAGGKGVSVGKPAELEGVFDIGFATLFTGGIKPVYLLTGADLNTVLTPNVYVSSTSVMSDYLNVPVEMNASFLLKVEPTGISGQVRQKLVICHKTDSKTLERFYYGSAWGEWVCVSAYGNTLLWSGEDTMGVDDTGSTYSIDLAERISKQPTGIVLVFAPYNGNGLQNHNFNTFFISKYDVSIHSGVGRTFALFNTNFGTPGTKYIYINNFKLTGHANNVSAGTANGITYNSGKWCLRYVIGV